MKNLFDSIPLGGLTLKNRLVRSATMERAADDSSLPSAEAGKIWRDLAEGGIGLIITGMIGVCENSRVSASMIKGYAPDLVEAYRPLLAAVRRSGAKIIIQLGHCGLKATLLESGGRPLGPSAVSLPRLAEPGAMTRDDIARVADGFAQTARRCKEAGADGVQLHAAHGYLLSQFLSPFFNRRQDEYGGDIDNRARIVFETLEAVRGEVGPDYPVLVKINFSDLAEPSITFEECAHICARLAERGLTAVELSAGLGNDAATSPIRRVSQPEEEGYFAAPALALAEKLPIPVISVGGYRDFAAMEKILNQGRIAAFAMSRPLICEPGLAARWQSGDRNRAGCISCNRCFNPREPLGCKYRFPA